MQLCICRHGGKNVLLIAALAALTACSSTPQRQQLSQANSCKASTDQAQQVKLDLVEQLLSEGSYYSALAHLEQGGQQSPRRSWLSAEAQRKTGLLSDAYQQYRELSLGCMAAAGHAGMAKILATRGDLASAHQHMLKARQLAPTNADIRNDYGFILLATGDFKAAQREFMTAMQLRKDHPVALRNMVVSLILDGDTRTAARMAKNNGIVQDEFKQLLQKSKRFSRPSVAQAQP